MRARMSPGVRCPTGRMALVVHHHLAAAVALELVPDFTVARARHHIEFDMNNLFGKPADREAFYEGLRRAGVPE